jgi:DNA-binding CsgD family transcriptional regulator
VGRATETRTLGDLLSSARKGRGRVALVRGEAGIGKTRLLQAITDKAAGQGLDVRRAEASAFEQSRPFGLVFDALGAAAAATDDRLSGLSRLLRSRQDWSGGIEAVPVEVHHLVDEFVKIFESLCASGCLVLVAENLHWADTSSLMFLQRILRLCAQYPALVLTSTRPTDRPEVRELISAATEPDTTRLELGPLDPRSVSSLAERLLGGSPGPRMATYLAKASGNPLFISELAASAHRRGMAKVGLTGEVELVGEDSPAGLDTAILDRLSVLPEETVELLRMAAISGHELDLDELTLLSGRDIGDLARTLRAASGTGLLRVEGSRLSFSHDLIQETLYWDWPDALRRGLHRELARLLANNGAPSHRVAHHAAQGAKPGDMDAVGWIRVAALESAPRAPLAAARLLESAIALVSPGEGLYDLLRTDLAVTLAWAGRVAEGEGVAQRVATETSDPELRGRAAWWLTSSLLSRGRPAEAGEIASRALEAGVTSDATRILLRLSEATSPLFMNVNDDATAGIWALLAESRRLGEPLVRCRCLVGVMMAEANRGRLEAANGFALEAVSDAESLPPLAMVSTAAHVCRVWLHEEQDGMEEAHATLQSLLRLGGSLPPSALAILSDTSSARLHLATGQWDAALVDIDSVVAWNDGDAGRWSDALAFRASILVHRGESGQAGDDLDRVDAQLASGGACWAVDHHMLARAFLLEEAGRLEEAMKLLNVAWGLADDVPMALLKVNVGPHLARWSAALGDPGMAAGVASDLESLARGNPGVRRIQAAALWCRGLAGGDTNTLRRGVELIRSGPRLLDIGFACEDMAAVQAAGGLPGAAREFLEEALRSYEKLRAVRRIASARARLRVLGVRTTSTGRRPYLGSTSGWDALSNTELKVAGLVAERLTNKEIADCLVVSRRTAETHVANVLRKLGCASRRDVAAVVRRHA